MLKSNFFYENVNVTFSRGRLGGRIYVEKVDENRKVATVYPLDFGILTGHTVTLHLSRLNKDCKEGKEAPCDLRSWEPADTYQYIDAKTRGLALLYRNQMEQWPSKDAKGRVTKWVKQAKYLGNFFKSMDNLKHHLAGGKPPTPLIRDISTRVVTNFIVLRNMRILPGTVEMTRRQRQRLEKRAKIKAPIRRRGPTKMRHPEMVYEDYASRYAVDIPKAGSKPKSTNRLKRNPYRQPPGYTSTGRVKTSS